MSNTFKLSFKLCFAAGVAMLMLAGTGHAQMAPGSSTQNETSFDIAVRTPPEFATLRLLIEKHNELQRYRAVTDLDDAELARLIVLAEANIRNLAGTLGYFSPTVDITQEKAGLQRPLIAITVTPGPVTIIASTRFDFAGDVASSQDAGAAAQKNDIQANWLLRKGQPFTQDAWSNAKTQALRGLVARRYPSGKINSSLADIDPASNTADLLLALDSGPLYRLGPLQITGVSRYSALLVPRLAQLKEGAVYDQNELIQAQQRIGTSGYFDSATVLIDVDADPAAVPVQVQVREAKLQKVVLGVGVSTDSGLRVSIEHLHNRAAGTDWRAVTKLQLEKKSPSLQTEWTSLPDAANWRWVGLARADRMDDNTLITANQRLRFGRTQLGERIDRNIYLQLDRSRVNASGGSNAGNTQAAKADTGDGSAISGNYVWTGRYFDGLPLPRSGYGLGFEVGGGFTLSSIDGGKRQPFGRGVGRWLAVYPFADSRVAVRAEAGAVMARDSARVPSGALFRTGGDSTVRGYGLRAIGIQLPGGIVAPGRYMAVGSIEWQRPIRSKGLPTDFESTFFIDAGGVADRPQALRASVGIGTGVRFKSPIGPLQIDLAYGVKVKSFRLHTSVGFVF